MLSNTKFIFPAQTCLPHFRPLPLSSCLLHRVHVSNTHFKPKKLKSCFKQTSSTNMSSFHSFQSQLVVPLLFQLLKPKILMSSWHLYFYHTLYLILSKIILVLLSNEYRIWLLFTTFTVSILFQATILSPGDYCSRSLLAPSPYWPYSQTVTRVIHLKSK